MSSTLVRNLTTVKLADGKWHLRGSTCESNVYPHTYSKWEGEQGWDLREELDGRVIRDFYNGCFRGSSRYADFVKDQLAAGERACRSWVRFVALEEMKRNVFCKSLDHINEPKDSLEKVRWEKVERRINRWADEILLALGKDFREWKPDKGKFVVVLNDNRVVVNGGINRCWAIPRGEGNGWKHEAKKFGKTAALRFVSHYRHLGATMERFVA